MIETTVGSDTFNAESDAALDAAAFNKFQQKAAHALAGEEVLGNIRTELPPLSSDPAALLERAEFMDRPEVLMQDPLNYSIARVIEHIIENNDTDAAKDFRPSFFNRTPPQTEIAPIWDIMRFFPAVELERVAARLHMLEDAGLIDYGPPGEQTWVNSPRVWQLEENDDQGFRLSDELKTYLHDAATEARAYA